MQILCLTEVSALVSWTPPPQSSLNGKLTKYAVTLKKNNGKIFKVYKTNEDKIEIQKLNPFTEYLVQVAARNSAACGPISSSLSFTTLEAGKMNVLYQYHAFYRCNEHDLLL